ncbi:methylmalonyl-CoA epimerase [Bacillus weihaiensis]|uniref:Methylmalonyl-CoA epimerase n=1 Tax=Bacillus weihaiensis TaxID=1547283 RepID=A0A1L3MQ70_9BACI|nr:methylmalonyl-CoA epimerase [Bacillus weihaiensis]APH04485.1 methylmalonyl-CoA epimerase [Bacillus weihaiensis]
MVNKVDHIGIAVHSISNALPFYQDVLSLSFLGEEEVIEQQVKVAFLKIGETKIELLEPLSSRSPIAKFLEKKGEGVHHIAFGTSNIHSRLEEIREKGIALIDEIPRIGAANMLIGFLHPTSTHGTLIELCEKRGEEE